VTTYIIHHSVLLCGSIPFVVDCSAEWWRKYSDIKTDILPNKTVPFYFLHKSMEVKLGLF